jgi:hypothetical protein
MFAFVNKLPLLVHLLLLARLCGSALTVQLPRFLFALPARRNGKTTVLGMLELLAKGEKDALGPLALHPDLDSGRLTLYCTIRVVAHGRLLSSLRDSPAVSLRLLCSFSPWASDSAGIHATRCRVPAQQWGRHGRTAPAAVPGARVAAEVAEEKNDGQEVQRQESSALRLARCAK